MECGESFYTFFNKLCEFFECYTYCIIFWEYYACTNSVDILNDRVELSHYQDTHNCLNIVFWIKLEMVDDKSTR